MIGGSERETILVVDDDGYARTLVAKILSQRGLHGAAGHGRLAGDGHPQEQPTDLIILDLRMPGPVDGEQLLNSLPTMATWCPSSSSPDG